MLTSQVVLVEVSICGYELLPHPPNVPDIAPVDFFLSPKLKFYLYGHHFVNNDKVICAVEKLLEDQDATFFCNGIAILKHCRMKCINVKGNCIEK